MTWYVWVIIVLLVWDCVAGVHNVGKDRGVWTSNDALAQLVLNGAVIAVIVALATS